MSNSIQSQAHDIGEKLREIPHKSKKLEGEGLISIPFLLSPDLSPDDLSVLKSYRLERLVRSIANFLLVILILNLALKILLLTSIHFRGLVIGVEFFCFAVVAILALIMRTVPRRGWVIATAIAIFPFAFGVLTIFAAIALFYMAGGLHRATADFYIPSDMLGRLSRFLKDIHKNKPEGWLQMGRLGGTKVVGHFFPSVALLLLPRTLYIIPAHEVRLCDTKTRKDGTIRITRIPNPDRGISYRIRLNLTSEGTQAWLSWVARLNEHR